MAYLMKPYTVLLLMAAVLSAAMAVSAVRMRANIGTRSFAILMSCVALWALVAFFEVIALDERIKVFCYGSKYLFKVTVPLAWLSFTLFYANRLRRWRMSQLACLSVIPLATLALVATNSQHGWMFASLQWHPSASGLFISRQFGPWFWVHTTYSYALLAIGFFYLLKSLLDASATYRRQLISLLIGALAPWLCNMMFIFNLQPFSYLELTPFAFSVSGLAFLWGVMRYQLLDLVPIAREFVAQHLQVGIIVVDEARRILDINPPAAQLVKASPDKLIGYRADRSIVWWPDIDPHLSDHPSDTHHTIRIELDGETRWFRASNSPLTKHGRTMGHVVVLGDITEIKKTEVALRLSEDRYKSLTDNAPIVVFALNETGVVTYVNPVWSLILGYPRERVIGQRLDRFVAQNQKMSLEKIFNQIISGQKKVAEISLELIPSAGSTRMFDLTAAVNSDTEGRVMGIIGLAKDITEEAKLQEQLLTSQKMEAIGTLAGGIAHDFNNLLMGIQANISLMRLEAAANDPINEKLNRVENQVQSGASLTRQLLGYARKGKYVVQTIDVRNLVEDTLHVVGRTNKQIQVHRHLGEEPLLMQADRGQIELVLLNLFVNAVDAMPQGGDLTLLACLVDARDLDGRWPKPTSGSYIKIDVIDTGVGMDEQTKERIFEPFFTTKEIGRGTGLGLASVYGVVKNHDGYIRAESVAGKGTTFQLLFPTSKTLRHPLPSAVPCREEPESVLPGGGTILLVDDEPTILEFCGEMIESLGYRVLCAANGHETLLIYRQQHPQIDLVILDMIMPVMDGFGVYQALKAINPEVRVLIASGFGINERAQTILSEGPHGYLKKPYTRNELANAVAKIMAPACKATLEDSALQN